MGKGVVFKRKVQKNIADALFKRKVAFGKDKSLYRKRMQYVPASALGGIMNLKYHFFDYEKILAPDFFSLIDNEEEVLAFIKQIRLCFAKHKKVFVVLSSVKVVTNDAILVLLSNMIQFRSHKIDFNGNFPRNVEAKRKIEESGFFEHLYNTIRVEDSYSIKSIKSSIYTHAQRNVAPEIADSLIKQASKMIWGVPKRCPGVQRAFIELMHNTNNHASDIAGEKHWWVSVTHDKKNKTVLFSFIDFGIGIFRSLKEKKPGDKFYECETVFRKCFPWADTNDKQLELILKGELHKTVTKNYYRGKGLPGIYEAFNVNKLASLVIISNNVYANVAKNDYHLLDNELIGTFVSWEINENIINLPWA